MRTLCFGLLFINLAFFGWAHWIDVAPPARAAAAVPTLHLTRGDGSIAADADADAGVALRCRSIGPFPDEATALSAAAAVLAARGLGSRARSVAGTVDDGYWVYLPPITAATARARTLARLKAAGITDAVALVQTDQPQGADRVSVGLFRDAEHAQSRAAAVRRLGLTPVVEPHHSAITRYWLDLTLPAGAADPGLADIGNAQGVLRVADSLKVIDCPAVTGAAAPVRAPTAGAPPDAATPGAATSPGAAAAPG